MKLFEKILMASEDVQAYLVSGKGYNGSTEIELFDGAVVTIGDLCDHEAYGSYVSGMKDMNTRKLAKGMTANSRYGIVDYVGVNESDVMGVKYRVGSKTAGLVCPAGVATRVRIPQVGDEFFIGDENFAAAPTVGSLYGADADGLFNATGVGDFKVKVEFGTDKITGAVNNGKKYYCTVVAV